MSTSDAENFVEEAERFEKDMSLGNTLAFLFPSITAEISKPLILDSQYHEGLNASNTRAIDRVVCVSHLAIVQKECAAYRLQSIPSFLFDFRLLVDLGITLISAS